MAASPGSLVHFEPENPQPLLDVCFADASHGVAVGAYGVIYVTTDGGAVWSQVPFEPEPLPGAEKVAPSEDEMETEVDLGFEFHLNAIARGPGQRMYLGAEAGRLFRSDDDGTHWRELPSPYDGSFHGILPLEGDALLAYGLRGNLFRSEDGGTTWTAIQTGTTALLDAGARIDERTVVVAGLAGVILVSHDGGRSFTLTQQDDRKAISVGPALGRRRADRGRRGRRAAAASPRRQAVKHAGDAKIAAWLEPRVFGHRKLILAAFALITAALGWIAVTGLKLDTNFNKQLPLQHEYIRTYLDHKEEFGGANRLLIAVMARDGNMFTPEFFQALKIATDEVFFIKGVDRARVQSLWTPNTRYTEVVEGGIEAGDVIPPDFKADAAGLARVRENILKAGIVGRLVANDFSGAMVSAQLLDADPETGKPVDYIAISRELERKVRARIEGSKVDVAVAGAGIGAHDRIREGRRRRRRWRALGRVVRDRDRDPDASPGLDLHPVAADRARAGHLLARRDGLDARASRAARLRRRPARHPGAVHHLRDRHQPRRAEDQRRERRRDERGRQQRGRAPHVPPAVPAGDRGAAREPRRVHHDPADPGAGHPRNGGHREPRHRRDHPDGPRSCCRCSSPSCRSPGASGTAWSAASRRCSKCGRASPASPTAAPRR